MKYIAETLYDLITYNNIPNGVHTYYCSKNNIELDFEIVTYKYPVILSNETNLYLGNTVADTQMLILKFENDLYIENGYILTPPVRKKGFVIYCNNILNNKGTISMTARGANTEGQNLYLYNNEMVPAVGGSPGTRAYYNIYSLNYASNGNSGINRGTGAGGSGGGGDTVNSIGAYGTSYSGGAGGGGVLGGNNSAAHDGKPNGGAGGNAYIYSPFYTCSCGGGAGNPGGAPYNYNTTGGKGADGTGGLLVIFANKLVNNGIISSNGSARGWAYRCSGGGSGGGSVNIFTKFLLKKGTVEAKGGTRGEATRGGGEKVYGGNGGNGTVTFTDCIIKQRINSNYYKDSYYQEHFDFNKLLEV